TNGARGRIIYHSATTGGAETVRAYIEPLNEIAFLPNDSLIMKDLTQVGSNYVEDTPIAPAANRTYTMIGGLRNANIDTQSVQISGALPTAIRPGTVLEINGERFNVAEIETYSDATVNPVLKLRPLSTTTLAATAGPARVISIVNPQTGVISPSGVSTRLGPDGVESIGRPADYQTNQGAGVGSTGYYTNTQAAREIFNPQKVQVTDNATVDYGMTADKAGFARLIYTLNFLQQQTSPLSKEDVAAANKILLEARTQITSLRASSGINQKTLVGITEQNSLQKSIANNNFDDLAKQDKTEAIATLTSLQTILEASYNSFARIQDLNLQSFLR
ncbi:hypothetical protein VZ95_20485, partial [Elstera litoralis]